MTNSYLSEGWVYHQPAVVDGYFLQGSIYPPLSFFLRPTRSQKKPRVGLNIGTRMQPTTVCFGGSCSHLVQGISNQLSSGEWRGLELWVFIVPFEK